MPTPDRSEHVTETVGESPGPGMRMGRSRPVSSSLAVTIGQVLHPPLGTVGSGPFSCSS